MDEQAWTSALTDVVLGLSTTEETRERARLMAARAVEVVPGAAHAAVLVRRRGRTLDVAAASSDVACEAALLGAATREAPDHEAASTAEPVWSDSLARETRWSDWTPGARRAGLACVLSLPFGRPGTVHGVLTLSAAREGVLTAHDGRRLAQLYAVHAGIALVDAHEREHLRTALDSRHEIGLAQGILMATYGLSVDQAFNALHRISTTTNVKLTAVAAEVVRTGQLPAA